MRQHWGIFILDKIGIIWISNERHISVTTRPTKMVHLSKCAEFGMLANGTCCKGLKGHSLSQIARYLWCKCVWLHTLLYRFTYFQQVKLYSKLCCHTHLHHGNLAFYDKSYEPWILMTKALLPICGLILSNSRFFLLQINLFLSIFGQIWCWVTTLKKALRCI